MKEDIISHFETQLDTLHIKKKQYEAEAMITEYFPSCRKRKANCKCKRVASIQQDKVEKLDFHPIEGYDGKIFYIAQRRPWKQIQGMSQDPFSFNSSFPIGNQNFSAWNSTLENKPKLMEEPSIMATSSTKLEPIAKSLATTKFSRYQL